MFHKSSPISSVVFEEWEHSCYTFICFDLLMVTENQILHIS